MLKKRPTAGKSVSRLTQKVIGYCPICNVPSVRRERRLDGNDTCANEHYLPTEGRRANSRMVPQPHGAVHFRRVRG